jgi:glycosyltransferase involved in cell wall biosynthesis
MSSGGFPAQMESIASLFNAVTLVIERVEQRGGGIPLPKVARVVPLRSPAGHDFRRKISVLMRLPYYLAIITRHVRAADVVHVPQPGDMSFLGMLVALILRKRMLVRYCGSWETNSDTTLMNKATQALMRAFAGGRNVMLATGIGNKAPATKMHWTFATAVSREEVGTVCPDLDRPVHKPLRMVYVGRISPEKGVGVLLKAIGKLQAETHLDESLLQLTIIGDGPQKARLVALAQKQGCTRLVSFTGHLNRRDLMNRLVESDVCVLPSLSESYCKARLDAMLCGVPVITTQAGFGREIVGAEGERGWVVPCGDVSALAAAIQNVLDRAPDYPAIRRRCREYVLSHTLDAWAQQIGQICARQWNMSFIDGKLCTQTK